MDVRRARGHSAAFEAAFDEFDRLDALMSVWKEGSEIERLNRAAGEKAVPISRDVLDVLSMARQTSEWTEGKFDVTFGVLSGLWKFDHDLDGNIPARADVLARLPLIDYQQLDVDDREEHRLPHDRRACACISAASAKATPSIARRRSCEAADSTTS